MAVFTGDLDRRRFVQRLRRVLHETGTKCLAWSLMSNHLHLSLLAGETPVSSVMHRLLSGYVGEFNRRHGRRGPLFQDRFWSAPLASHQHELRAVRYVHLNPVRSPLVPNLDALAEYEWTGHRELLGHATPRMIEVDWVLSSYGPDRETARRNLLIAMRDDLARLPPLDPAEFHEIAGRDEELEWPRPSAGLVDVAGCAQDAFLRSAWRKRERGAREMLRLRTAGWTPERVLAAVCARNGVAPSDVTSGSHRPPLPRLRALTAFHAVTLLGFPQTEVAALLGVSQQAVSGMLARVAPAESERLWVPRSAE